MSALNDSFNQLLARINPDKQAVRYAQKAHEPVRDHLESDDNFSEHVEDTFLYGSYKRNTAVGKIKDVDIVVLTNFDINLEENTPDKILRKLKASLTRYYKNADNTDYQRRSIRVNDPLPDDHGIEITLDVIPAVAINGIDGILLVPDIELKEWVESHPKGHINYTSRLNDDAYSGQQFVPLVKILKWWWKYQCSVHQPSVERPKPQGFWIEVLTGQCFDPNKKEWADHFIATLQNIVDRYGASEDVPKLPDPGLPGKTIQTSMTKSEFKTFIKIVGTSLELAKKAYNEVDTRKSSEIWQTIFGEYFPESAGIKPNNISVISLKREDFPRQWSH